MAWDRIELPTRGFSVVNHCYFSFSYVRISSVLSDIELLLVCFCLIEILFVLLSLTHKRHTNIKGVRKRKAADFSYETIYETKRSKSITQK